MKEQLQVGLDFYYETEKENPFHIHRSSNSASQGLVHLRNHAFILNKICLLPIAVQTQNHEKIVQLFATAIEGILNNSHMNYRNFQVVRDFVNHIQYYHRVLMLNAPSPHTHWPKVRAALMTIEDKIPKSGHHWVREYVLIRRALLEPDKKYFLSQMLAKKIDTQQLKNLIAFYKEEITESELNQIIEPIKEDPIPKLTYDEAVKAIRMIPLTDDIEDWKLLEQLMKSNGQMGSMRQEEREELDEYIVDILESYEMSKGEIGKVRSNSVRGRVLEHYLKGCDRGEAQLRIEQRLKYP